MSHKSRQGNGKTPRFRDLAAGGGINMLQKKFINEEGFSSAFVVLFIVTLGLLGLGATMVLQNEGAAVGDQYTIRTADYAAESAVYFALERARMGFSDEAGTLTANGLACTYENESAGLYVNVTAHAQSAEDDIVSTISVVSRILALSDIPYWLADTPSGPKRIYNEDGDLDPDLEFTEMDSVPTMDLDYYWNIADEQEANQINVQNDYPTGATDFWKAPGEPWVTYVKGSMTLAKDVTLYGIVIVEGDVILKKGMNVVGVLYLPTGGTIIKTRENTWDEINVTGGIIVNGESQHRGNNWFNVYHDKSYLEAFYDNYAGGVEPIVTSIKSWSYNG